MPEMPPSYDGAADPIGFLQAYEEAVWAADKDDKVMANWLPMALIGTPCAWLLYLPVSSMASLEELCGLFITHFMAPMAPLATALLRGSQAPPSDHHIKQVYRQIRVTQVSSGAPPGWAALSRPICDTILKRLEGPTKDRTAY